VTGAFHTDALQPVISTIRNLSVLNQQRSVARWLLESIRAFVEDWILITNDWDFGEKVYREQRPPNADNIQYVDLNSFDLIAALNMTARSSGFQVS